MPRDSSSRRARPPYSPACRIRALTGCCRVPTRPLLHVPSLLCGRTPARAAAARRGRRETPASSFPRRRFRRRWRCGSCIRNIFSPLRWRYSGSRPRPCRLRAAAFCIAAAVRRSARCIRWHGCPCSPAPRIRARRPRVRPRNSARIRRATRSASSPPR